MLLPHQSTPISCPGAATFEFQHQPNQHPPSQFQKDLGFLSLHFEVDVKHVEQKPGDMMKPFFPVRLAPNRTPVLRGSASESGCVPTFLRHRKVDILRQLNRHQLWPHFFLPNANLNHVFLFVPVSRSAAANLEPDRPIFFLKIQEYGSSIFLHFR